MAVYPSAIRAAMALYPSSARAVRSVRASPIRAMRSSYLSSARAVRSALTSSIRAMRPALTSSMCRLVSSRRVLMFRTSAFSSRISPFRSPISRVLRNRIASMAISRTLINPQNPYIMYGSAVGSIIPPCAAYGTPGSGGLHRYDAASSCAARARAASRLAISPTASASRNASSSAPTCGPGFIRKASIKS